MKNYTTKCIQFKGIKSKKIEGSFTGGKITSDAGSLLLREVNKKTGFLKLFSKAIIEKRHSSYIRHELEEMLTQRVFAIACGHEDGNDHEHLRKDPIYQMAVNKDPSDEKALASPSTLCRFENAIDRQDIARISKVFIEQFISSYKTPPKEIILDFDATDDRIHGNQEQSFFHGYYYNYCYLPLYVFCGEKLVLPYLRPSNIDASKHSWAILSMLVKRFRQEWPNVKIKFRADSGFCRHRMLTWCDRQGIEYAVGIASNSRLRAMSADIIEHSRKTREKTGEKVRQFGEVEYGALTWKYSRRVIVKAEQLDKGENIRYVVTNMDNPSSEIYDQFYVQRGDMENRIKEQQLDLFADRTSCHLFVANQFRLFLSSAAYVLLETLRRIGLSNTDMANAQCQTIRCKLLKIGAVIIYNTRRVQIKMSESYPYQPIFRQAAAQFT